MAGFPLPPIPQIKKFRQTLGFVGKARFVNYNPGINATVIYSPHYPIKGKIDNISN